jgi:predicted DNA binding CopG/RHH family protein
VVARLHRQEVPLRFPPERLFERLDIVAERRGLRYQTYVKMLLHQALVADARRLA